MDARLAVTVMIYLEYQQAMKDKDFVDGMNEAVSRRYWSGKYGTVTPGGGIDDNGVMAPGFRWLLAWGRSFKNNYKGINSSLISFTYGRPDIDAYQNAGKILNPLNPSWMIFSSAPVDDCSTNPNSTWCRPWDGYNPPFEDLERFKEKWDKQDKQPSADECGVYYVWGNHVTLTFGQDQKKSSAECRGK